MTRLPGPGPPRLADRSCCCQATPVVKVLIPPSSARPHSVDLLLCGHHKIPQSFPCKARTASGGVSGLTGSFPRYKARGHWVHDVLILHGGNPFLLQTMPHGVAGLVHGPDAAEGTIKHLKRIKDPVSLRYRTDSGDVIEVVCAQDDLPRARGSHQRPSGLAPDHYGLTGAARASTQPQPEATQPRSRKIEARTRHTRPVPRIAARMNRQGRRHEPIRQVGSRFVPQISEWSTHGHARSPAAHVDACRNSPRLPGPVQLEGSCEPLTALHGSPCWLHVHSQIAHTARTVTDGKWRAPDSLGYNEDIGAVAAIVSQHLEEALTRRFGLAWGHTMTATGLRSRASLAR